MIIDNPIVSGSLNVQNNVTASNGLFTNNLTVEGTIYGAISGSSATASYVEYENVANKPTLVSSSAQLADDISGSFTSLSSSIASGRLKNTTDTLTGDLTVTGTLTAQDLVVQEITSSIIYSSGSNKFGNELSNSHNFTGSVNITGSLNVNGAEVGTGKLDETVFNAYTSSTDTRLDNLEATGSDQESRIDTLEGKTLISSSAQIGTEISGAFTDVSSSFSTRVTNLEDFSSSLDATFATDADLNLVSASVDNILAATSSYALSASISGAFTSVSSSIAADIEDIIDGTTTVASASHAVSSLTASYALNAGAGAGFPFSGSAIITGSLEVSGSTISGSFIGDGSGLTGITVSSTNTVTSSFSSTGSVTILHSFNSKNVSVSVYDDNDILIIPQQVTLLDNNNVKIDFGGNTTGFAVLAKGGHLVSGSVPVPQLSTVTDSFSSTTSHTVTHNFGTKEVIVSVYENDELIIPDSITTPTTDTVTVTFPEAISGRVVVVKAGHIVSGSIPYSNLLDSPLISGSGAITASGHLVPSENETYDLGSSTKRWRDIYLSGSSIYLGNTVITEGNIVTTGSLSGSLPAGVISGSAQIATEISGAFTSISSSFASGRLKNTTDTLTGDLTVTGTLTAQEFHTEFVSASIIYESGSTQFGDSSDDTHTFTGTGSFDKVGIGTDTNLTGKLNFPQSDYGEAINIYSHPDITTRSGIGKYYGEVRHYIPTNDFISFYGGGPSGTELMRISGSGLVGIGTTDPGSRKLAVHKNTAITSGFNDISEFLDTTLGVGGSVSLNVGKENATRNLGKMAFKYAGDNSTSNALNFGFYDADNLMTILANRNVGIGVTNPGNTLHISGSGIKVEGSSADNNYITGVRTGGGTIFSIYDNNNVVYYNSDTSMVFRANQLGGSGGAIYLNGGDVSVGEKLVVTGDITGSAARFTANAGHAFGDTPGTSRVVSFLNSTLGNGDVAYLTIGKQESVGDQAELSYYHVSDGSGNNKLQLGLYGDPDAFTIDANSNVNVTDGNFYVNNGSVGVGKTSAATALDVSGVTTSLGLHIPQLRTLPNITGAIQIDMPNTSYNAIRFYSGSLTHTIHGFAPNWAGGASNSHLNLEGIGATSFGIWTDPDMIVHHGAKNGTGNVGIGVGDSTPGAALHVERSTDATLLLKSTTNGNGVIYFEGPTRKWGMFAGSNSGKFSIKDETGANEIVTINTGGLFGINTTDPKSRLHVAGSGNQNRGNILIGDATSGAAKWSVITGAHYDQNTGSGNGAGSAGIMMIGTYASNGANRLVLGGNIYEANPATQFEVWTHTASTHTTGGSRKMLIQGNGNVALGAGSSYTPSGNVHLYYPNSADMGSVLTLGNNGCCVANRTGIGFKDGSYYRSGIVFETDGANGYAGHIIFKKSTNSTTLDGTTEVMRIDASSNVGIGSTDPQQKLDVNGNINIPGTNKIVFNSEPTGWYIHARTTESTNFMGSQLKNYIVSGGGANEGIAFGGQISAPFKAAMEVKNSGEVYVSGSMMIGTTSNPLTNAEASLEILNTFGDAVNIKHTYNGNNTINIWQTGTTAHDALAFYKGNTQTKIGYIEVSTTSVTYSTTNSDTRLKKNAEDWNDSVLSSFAAIEPKKFHLIQQEDTEEKLKGFMAQDMIDKFPEAYPENREGYYSFNPSGMVTYLMKAVKELKEIVDQQQAEINALKNP